MQVFGVVGWKNGGKTTLVERLVADITGRGYRVSTIKHAHHGFDVDQEGRDSWRHREAGAAQVLVSSRRRWALMTELREHHDEPTLEELVQQLAPVDLVLVEGYKRDRHAKIEAWRRVCRQRPIALSDPTVRAVARDEPQVEISLPQFSLDDVRGIADFILQATDLEKGGGP